MVLALKLLLTPLLIALATLAGRRWGPAVSGWFIGFPLTSGPVLVILALQDGPAFAARAAVGILGGLASIGVFCLGYATASRSRGIPASLASGTLAYAVATLLWSRFQLSLWPTAAVGLAVNGAVIALLPKDTDVIPAARTGRWDIPARMAIAAAFVFTLTTVAARLGSHLSGLVTPFPIFGSTLAAFAHRQQGAAAARSFLRGNLISLYGFAAFFIVVGALLPRWPLGWTLLAATAASLALGGLTLRGMPRVPRSPLGEP
jgi:hypothetical protein